MKLHSKYNEATLGNDSVDDLNSIFMPHFELTDAVLKRLTDSAIFDKIEAIRFVAQKTIDSLLDQHPDLAEKILPAISDALQDIGPSARQAAQQTLQILVEKRPDIIDASLIDITAKIAVTDKNDKVRASAQRTLETLAWSVTC